MNKIKSILSFDQATVTGWAFAKKPFQDRSKSGIIDLSSCLGRGNIGSAFLIQVTDLVTTLKPDVILYERAFSPNRNSLRLQFLLSGLIELTAWRLGCKIEAINPSAIKIAASGDYRASKEVVLKASLEAGYGGKPSDEADAQWMLTYFIQKKKIGEYDGSIRKQT